MRTIESYTDSVSLSIPYFPWKMGGLLLKKSLYNVHCISKIF